MMLTVSIKIFPHGVGMDLPCYATSGSAGMDLRAAIDSAVVLKPMSRYVVPTGIAIALPDGYEAEIRPRSGLAFHHGITVLNTPGTIDSDFRGELGVLLINFGEVDFILERGVRIAQLVVQKHERVTFCVVESLDDTRRADGGYGSTGIR
ncbi:MAG: dUTP diphosphatase [Holosporaceae bacterium]|jgi:dUTP pyrophosphatase|nr:dUTP diphosphatase [Holosporaceae bacterium]